MENLCFIGDTHRRWQEFQQVVDKANLENYAIIHLGDGGFGFDQRRVEMEVLEKYNKWLVKRNCIMYNIRGNHDNPYWFKTKAKLLAFLQKEDREVPYWRKEDFYYIYYYVNPREYADFITGMTNIKFVQDYTIISEAGHNILCVGGATSIDRMIKRQQGLYNVNEPLKYHPLIKNLKGADIMATHNAPHFAYPQVLADIVLEFAKRDITLLHELEEERKLMTKICNEAVKNNPLTHWFYGHFHQYRNEIREGIQFICLPPNELFDINTRI